MRTRGIIFDLDGTLVDSGLDFHRMRREMELPDKVPILEAIEELPAAHAARCRAILDKHERAGAARATIMPGVREFLAAVDQHGLRRAVVTRNCRASAVAVLERLDLPFELILSRDDGPVKPHPAAVEQICTLWNATPQEVVVLGDYWFDIDFGRRAGTRTVLFTRGRPSAELRGSDVADFVLHSFADAEKLLAWLG